MTVLLAKAKETSNISSAKIATLEALIKKMPTRIKSAMPEIQPSFKKNPEVQLILNDIFAKFPEHKRALFLQSKYMNDEEINPHEMSELRQFQRIAAKK
jgi:5'-deoxynucleotidase YfbR-like HD superfamily hydrolase